MDLIHVWGFNIRVTLSVHNPALISLWAIAPCGTYRLSDTLKTAQTATVVIVLEQLTHGGHRE